MPTLQQLQQQKLRATRAAAGYQPTPRAQGNTFQNLVNQLKGGGGIQPTAPAPTRPTQPPGMGGMGGAIGGATPGQGMGGAIGGAAPGQDMGGAMGGLWATQPMGGAIGGATPGQPQDMGGLTEPPLAWQINAMQQQMSNPNYQDPQVQENMRQQIERMKQQTAMGGNSGWPKDASGNPTVPGYIQYGAGPAPTGAEGNQYGQYGAGPAPTGDNPLAPFGGGPTGPVNPPANPLAPSGGGPTGPVNPPANPLAPSGGGPTGPVNPPANPLAPSGGGPTALRMSPNQRDYNRIMAARAQAAQAPAPRPRMAPRPTGQGLSSLY
jgi:hypothetical protein